MTNWPEWTRFWDPSWSEFHKIKKWVFIQKFVEEELQSLCLEKIHGWEIGTFQDGQSVVPKSTTEEASAIFSFRTRMARFEENYKNGRNNVLCPLCHLQYDTQSMAFQCQKIGSEVRVIENKLSHTRVFLQIFPLEESQSSQWHWRGIILMESSITLNNFFYWNIPLTFLCLTNFGSRKKWVNVWRILWPKIVSPKELWVQQILCSQKKCGFKNLLFKEFWVQKTVVQTNLGPTKVCV